MDKPSVSLDKISPQAVSSGAYRVSYKTEGLPADARLRVLLSVGSANHTLDISGRPRANVIDASNLPKLLELMAKLGAWGSELDCSIVIQEKGKTVASSRPQTLLCPVPPLAGPLTLASIPNERPKLTYPGNGHGRLLKEIGGKYYFVHGSQFETDLEMRGFDCTTFPMALLGCKVNMAGKYGTALADALGARRCAMEMKQEAAIKAFFSDKGRAGTFFMWSAGHVVIVKNAVIYEFTLGGFKRSTAGDWRGYRRAPQKLWWIRKLAQAC